MHRTHLDKILRDLDVAWAVWPILEKHSLSVEEGEKSLAACGVARAGIVAAMAVRMRRSASE